MFYKLWTYKEGLIINTSLLIVGIIINYFFNVYIDMRWPTNLYLILILVLCILMYGTIFRKTRFFQGFSGKKNAVVSLFFYLVLILLSVLIPQDKESSESILWKTGCSHILSSFSFILIQAYILLVLGMVIFRKLYKPNLKNITFFLNHFGLWLLMTAIGFGIGDRYDMTLQINKNHPVHQETYENRTLSEYPDFSIQLIRFSIDFYKPKAYIVDALTGDIQQPSHFIELAENRTGNLDGWNITVNQYLSSALKIETSYEESASEGSAPATYITAVNNKTKDKIEGWISCGSEKFRGSFLKLTDDALLIMAEPEIRNYCSEIKLITKDNHECTAEVSVNHPVNFNGWKIYQTGYDLNKGQYSDISIIRLIKDPWLWIVYTGLIMISLGAVYLIFTGKRIG